MEIQISNMLEEDLLCISSVWSTEFDSFWPFSTLENEFKNPNSLCFVAKCENEIVGVATLWKSVDDIHITNIVVKKSFRGNGISNVLLDKLIEVSKNLNYSSITLEVNENNTIARKLYCNHGFKELGIRKNYYNNKDNAIIMTLFLR